MGKDDEQQEAAEPPERRIGFVLGGYRLLAVLGHGGMGIVYLAEHARLGRKVALKMLRPEYSSNPRAIRRFFHEARVVNQISHENILEITDFMEGIDGANFYVSELLQGVVLAQLLRDEGLLSLDRSLRIATQIASALGAVHAAGIVHRDLKPDNIFLIRRGDRPDFVKLLDFGVAKLLRNDQILPLDSTLDGTIIGTPDYMSPEQAAGEAVDSRSDIYTFGALVYQLVCGRKVFQAKNFGEIVIKHMTVAPTPPSQIDGLPYKIPAALETVVMACLEKDPKNRPQTMRPVEAQLRFLVEDATWRGDEHTPEPRKPPAAPTPQAEVETAPAEAVAVPPSRRSSQTDEMPIVPARRWSPVAVGAPLVVLIAALGLFLALRAPKPVAPSVAKAATPPSTATSVTLSLVSTPPGAEVRRQGSTRALGVTPLSFRIDAESRSERFVFALEGYEPKVEEVSLRADASVSVLLTAAQPGVRPPPPGPATVRTPEPHKSETHKKDRTATSRGHDHKRPKGRPADPGDVMDPFAEE